MKIRLLIPIVLVIAAGIGVWWWFFGAAGAEIPVSEAEARRYLDRIVEAAEKKDLEAVCHLNGAVANCRHQLDRGCDETPFDASKVLCKDTVPKEPPRVESTRYHEKDTSDGTPGRILVVSGVDGLGRPYKSEIMVFRENRYNFKAINAVYWSNAYIIEGDTVRPPEQ